MSHSDLPTEKPPKTKKWFHFRWKLLLIVFLLLLVPLGYFAWRQSQQQQVITELKSRGAIVRTEAIPIPLLELIAGKDFSEQIIEVYWVADDVSEEDLMAVAGASTLRKLELTNSKVAGDGLKHIVGLGDLYTLHCTGTNIGDKALTHIAQLKSLEILSLNATQISNSGLKKLAGLSKLERLFLDSTGISDEGLTTLSELTKLKELSLKNLPITDSGLLKLKTLRNLEILALDNNPHLTREGILELRNSIPKLVLALDEQSDSNPATQSRNTNETKSSAKPDNP